MQNSFIAAICRKQLSIDFSEIVTRRWRVSIKFIFANRKRELWGITSSSFFCRKNCPKKWFDSSFRVTAGGNSGSSYCNNQPYLLFNCWHSIASLTFWVLNEAWVILAKPYNLADNLFAVRCLYFYIFTDIYYFVSVNGVLTILLAFVWPQVVLQCGGFCNLHPRVKKRQI